MVDFTMKDIDQISQKIRQTAGEDRTGGGQDAPDTIAAAKQAAKDHHSHQPHQQERRTQNGQNASEQQRGDSVAQGVIGTLGTMAMELAARRILAKDAQQPVQATEVQPSASPQMQASQQPQKEAPQQSVAAMDKSALAAAAGLGDALKGMGAQNKGTTEQARAGSAQSAEHQKQSGITR
jgi:hypothetical protein